MGSFTMNHNYKIPKQHMNDNISIYLPFYDVELVSNKTNVFSTKSIHFIKDNNNIGTLILDERDSTIKMGGGLDNSIVSSIHEKFIELKKSNINYGNIGLYPETSDGYEYTGVENITIETFFEYLRMENREQIINKII